MNKTRSQSYPELSQEPAPALRSGMHIHLVGIGGSGMSAIAWLLLERGFELSGSDLQRNEQVARLEQAGARVFEGHHAQNIAGAELVVISSAVPRQNVEVEAAREAGIAVWKRADLLGALMNEMIGLAVAGTHGKTTTTSMIAHIMLEVGLDPSVIVGGVQTNSGRSGRAGGSRYLVVEADEYDYMFLGLRPRIAVVTNMEHDHPDLFETPQDYQDAFKQFVARIDEGGLLVACRDDAGVQALLETVEHDGLQTVTYGFSESEGANAFGALDRRPNQLGGSDFIVRRGGETLGIARLRLPGEYNVLNALAAVAVCDALGIAFPEIVKALISFGGVGRRFQLVGEVGDVTVIDDYAHHPTEIRATLAAARQRFPGRRLWAVWQPHTYSRTRLLWQAFVDSFGEADRVIVLDIYRSRETDTLGLDAAQIVAGMEHPYVRHIGAREDAFEFIIDRILPGDVLLTLGAGDGNAVGEWVLQSLKERVQPESTGGM